MFPDRAEDSSDSVATEVSVRILRSGMVGRCFLLRLFSKQYAATAVKIVEVGTQMAIASFALVFMEVVFGSGEDAGGGEGDGGDEDGISERADIN